MWVKYGIFLISVKCIHFPYLIIVLQSYMIFCATVQKTVFKMDLRNYLNTLSTEILKILKPESKMTFHADFDPE